MSRDWGGGACRQTGPQSGRERGRVGGNNREKWGGDVTYPSCVILAEVFISAAIFCSLTFDSETTPIPPLLRGNEVKKEKEGGGDGRRRLVNGGKYGRSLPPSLPAGRLFLGQGCAQKQQGFSPIPTSRQRGGGRREGGRAAVEGLVHPAGCSALCFPTLGESHRPPPSSSPPPCDVQPSTGRQQLAVPLSAQLLLPEPKAPRSPL